ncbi:odorant binding protein [Danaus plexippus plexippus]|uniref:Odorant binding protein n=1 Tax=Danaus plexippus plexippus TaxID=278856 RepID=A0A212ET75_DANPL|nr:odorant binding protein [Danaus plexippus plexippus]
MLNLLRIALFIVAVNADLLNHERTKGATLKPISVCCDIPELGDPKPLAECSNMKLQGPCSDVQCVFEKSGFLLDKQTLNKEGYRNHLMKWLEGHKEWKDGIEKAISDCVDVDLRQYLDYPCKAYDVFTCTGIAMLKVVLSDVPPHCRGPPPGGANPSDCCKLPKVFTEEDFKECGIEKPTKERRVPECSKQICLLKRYELMKDDTNVDKDAVAAFLDKYSEGDEDTQSAVEATKQKCLNNDLPNIPEICEPSKIVFCVAGSMLMNCPKWDESEDCQKLKDHFENCNKYFPKK